MRKYIVIGLGNFGSTLAQALTDNNDDVIAVDIDINKIEAIKDKVSHAVALDTRELHALNSLPISDVDAVIVGIGEAFEASIMTTALLKQLKAKKIICRTINQLHTTILESLKVDEILMPEQDAALKLANRLDLQNVMNSLNLNTDYSIVEIKAPKRYVGQKLIEINFKERYGVELITLKKYSEKSNIFGLDTAVYQIDEECLKQKLEAKDILVFFGKNNSIIKMTQEI
ncbi:MAG: potassium channel family protein [Luteibaculaceae bacterium]